MMIGATKKTDYPDTGVCIHAGTQRLPHQYRRLLDSGSLASIAHHRHHRHCHYHWFPYLEAQTR